MSKPMSKERGLKGGKKEGEELGKDEFMSTLGIAFHTALRKASSHPDTSKIWRLISGLEEEDWLSILNFVYECIESHIQQKPTVTKEEIRDVIMGMEQAIKKPPVDYLISNDLKIAIDFLANWLKSKGLKVED